MNVNAILNNVMGTAGAGIDKAVQGARSGGMPSGLLGGAAAGGLAALLLSNKKARKMGGKALTYGGMAAIGGLAYKAWRDHKEDQTRTQPAQRSAHAAAIYQQTAANTPAPPAGSIFDLANQPSTSQGEDMRLVVIRAMISAAKADGHIDADERTRIEGQIKALQIGQDEQQFLIDQLNAPSDPIAIARLSGSLEQATEIYAASALAVDVDTPEERRYLERLADGLHLPEDLRQRLDEETAIR
ncbi:tellurite resistance TerB family protein [Hwanghaeella grinnelliae]|uniref:Tellurite resistance TerB family protein n=1 Tax=Hwanghaeella grinnelliae TaxID=2500179 RepID=A0A437QYF1_9PROT|nr:tellurite resistance TerB family protein [Hwanghaeella grinnelliae]RVU39502.1 tellurite resistance TerB family protein [Hwanghaeella grinnelliae]